MCRQRSRPRRPRVGAGRLRVRAPFGSHPKRPPAAGGGADDARLAELSDRWLAGTLRLSPIAATGIGDHRYDAEIDDLSQAGRDAQLAFHETTLAELDTRDPARLGREAQVDASILCTRA